MKRFGKLGRSACSAALVLGMCWPVGLALADDDAAASDEQSPAALADASGQQAAVAADDEAAVQDEDTSADERQADSSGGDADGDAGGADADEDADGDAAASAAADGGEDVPDIAGADVADAADAKADAADAKADAADAKADAADAKAGEAPVDASEAIARARAAVAEGDRAASKLPALRSELESGASSFQEVATELASDIAARNAAEQALAEMADVEGQARLAYAQARMDAVAEDAGELLSAPVDESDGFGMARAHVRTMAAWDALVSARAAHEGALHDAGELRERVSDGMDAFRSRTESAASAAFDMESACADMRRHDREAAEALEGAPDGAEGVAEARAEVAAARSRHDAARASAQEACGEWYEISERIAGAEGALTFGAGVDFALPEDEFVSKWGAAIDRFLSGRGAPLAGYGEAMARSAYKWRIDPRLCAAVSITESSGGMYCIRPHNAWGWGAADSDPYGLAWQWGSWEEAIEAWHKGVATNTAGLATARSLSAFGEIYASSTEWASNTAKSMAQIVP